LGGLPETDTDLCGHSCALALFRLDHRLVKRVEEVAAKSQITFAALRGIIGFCPIIATSIRAKNLTGFTPKFRGISAILRYYPLSFQG